MFDPMMLSLIALGLSLGAMSIKLITWFLKTDPKVMAQSMGWVTACIAAASVIAFVAMLAQGRLTMSLELAAAVIFAGTLFGPRLLHQWRKIFSSVWRSGPTLDTSQPITGNPGSSPKTPDAELVRRSVEVLEDYLRKELSSPTKDQADPQKRSSNGSGRRRRANGKHTDSGDDGNAGSMSEGEALEILGLSPGAQASEIDEAHRRMIRKVHPDQGGSNYLTIKVNEARETLRNAMGGQTRPASYTRKSSRPPPSQRPDC